MAAYSGVSNRRGVWNSRGRWKKYQKPIVEEVGIVRGLEKTEKFNTRGGGLAFKLLFSFLF